MTPVGFAFNTLGRCGNRRSGSRLAAEQRAGRGRGHRRELDRELYLGWVQVRRVVQPDDSAIGKDVVFDQVRDAAAGRPHVDAVRSVYGELENYAGLLASCHGRGWMVARVELTPR